MTSKPADKLFSCKTAHDWAVSSICIVVQHKPVKRAWPFQIESVDFGDVARLSESEAASRATAQIVPPVGNTGGTPIRGANHV